MIRLQIPFLLKIYLLIILLLALLLQMLGSRVNRIVSDEFIQGEYLQLEGVKTLFYHLLRSKIATIEREAKLLAGQSQVQQTLEMQEDGKLLTSFLVLSFPHIEPHELMIVTDRQGKVVDGEIPISDGKQIRQVRDLSPIQSVFNRISLLPEVLNGETSDSYVMMEDGDNVSLFAVSSVPVWDTKKGDTVIGAVTLGFPVDETLARDLRSGSRFQIGFVLGDRMITSTLDPLRSREFRRSWELISPSQRQALVDKPQLIPLDNERYLAYASHLPSVQGESGLFVILCSLEETFHLLQQMKNSILWVSAIILCGTLLIGYILTKSVTAPVKILEKMVSKIASGDYSVKVSVRTGDELETLGQEINRMADTLQQRQREIQNYVKQIEAWNQELETKVAERTQDLEEKNFSLSAISRELGDAYAHIDDEMKVVGELQRNLMPKSSLDFPGLQVRSLYLPNERAGGDYYDFISIDPRRIYVLIADVSGHGTPAAFIMGITRALAHSLIPHIQSPAHILFTLNNILFQTVRSGEYVTMFLGRVDIDSHQLTYSIAGHHPPFWFKSGSLELEELSVERGIPLGILENSEYEEINKSLQPGDRLFLFTDGVIEAFDEHRKPYGIERLQTLIRNHSDQNAQDFLDTLIEDLEEHVQRPLDLEALADDVTLVVMDFLPVVAPVSIPA